MVNFFAFRSPNLSQLSVAQDPIGVENDRFIKEAIQRADKIVVAWGEKGALFGRDQELLGMLASKIVECLGKTKTGYPRHPLYVKVNTLPSAF